MNLPVIQGHNLLTHSRQQCFQTCRRKHYFRYVLGVRPASDAKPLRLGRAIHEALDLHGKGVWADDAITRALVAYDDTPSWVTSDEDAHAWYCEREYARAMLRAYFEYYASCELASNLRYTEVVASELPFDLPIVSPDSQYPIRTFRNAGKIDKIVRLADGRLAIMEHKTTSDAIDPGSDYWLRLVIDQQISRYMCAAKELGYDVQTILYDVMLKPSHSPKLVPMLDEDGLKIVLDENSNRVKNKDGSWKQVASGDSQTMYQRRETPAEYGQRVYEAMMREPARYFARREVPRLSGDLERYLVEQYHQAKDMHQAVVNNWHFRNTSACIGFGRCEYLDVCMLNVTRDRPPHGMVAVDNLNPELGATE